MCKGVNLQGCKGIDDGFNTVGVFKCNDDFLCYNIDDEKWFSIYYEKLNRNNKTSKLVKLIENSSENIEFILHPFFTNEDHDIFNLLPEYIVDIKHSEDLYIQNKPNKMIVHWKDGLKLHINRNENTYIIKKDDNFVSGFVDNETHFQIGDCCTRAELLNNGDLMIYNSGDVCSLVIVKLC